MSASVPGVQRHDPYTAEKSGRPAPGGEPPDRRPVDPVDETSKESFPASDPPSWTPERTGAPDKSAEEHGLRQRLDPPQDSARR